MPSASSAGRSTWSTSVSTVASAAPPVRRTIVFRLFRTWAAISSATPGLASKLAPIVPTGMRSSRTCRPFASVRLEISRSRGSSAAVASSWRASVVTRCSSRRSLSRPPSSSVAPATSRSFAASTSATRSSSNWAARSKAGPTAVSVTDGSAAAAATASRSTSSRIVLYFVHSKQHDEGGHESRSASREVEGSGPTTPRQPASQQGANRPSSLLGSM